MGKYARRKLMKSFRRNGLPFIDACKFARFKSVHKGEYEIRQAYADVEIITLCQCCGPEILAVTLSDGKRHQFKYGSLEYVGVMSQTA